MPIVTIHYQDGEERQFEVNTRQTVLEAGLNQGLPLIHQCEGGSCGTCVARLLEGETSTAPDRAITLFPGEIRDGLRLICSTYVEGESARFELSYPFNLARSNATQTIGQATVRSIDWLSQTVARLRLELASDREYSFVPGQFARLKIPNTDAWRSYSMSSPASDLPMIEFLIRYLPGGVMSEWLRNGCQPGDQMDISDATGAFTIQEGNSPAIMIAGGTGLAPMMSMLDTIRHRKGARKPVLLCFGCTRDEDFFFEDELELRQFWMPHLKVRSAVMETSNPSGGRRIGTAVSLIEDADLRDPNTVAYICGPPPMVESARERLIAGGMSSQKIYTEQFRSSEA